MADSILADAEASGIYQIRNLANGKRYIGSAKCFRVRWGQHRRMLANGSHYSRHMQASWNKHGDSSFAFEILEECAPAELIAREQAWLDLAAPEFNTCPTAGNTFGRRHSSATRAKIASKKAGLKMPPRSAEHLANLSAARKGRIISPESIAKMKESKRLNPQTFTDERRRKVSEILKAQYASGVRSRERPSEYRAKIAATLRGRPLAEETKRKIGDFFRGRKVPNRSISEEGMRGLRESGRKAALRNVGRKPSAESVAKMAASLRGRKLSPDHRAKLAQLRKSMWSDPSFKAKMSAIHRARWARKKGIPEHEQYSLQGI